MTYTPVPDRGLGLRLHLNENTAGCSPAVLAALRSLEREDTAFYPDYTDVTAAAARYFGVEPEWVQLTNGLDEGLHVVAQGVTRGRVPPGVSRTRPREQTSVPDTKGSGLADARHRASKGSGLADARHRASKGSGLADARQDLTPSVIVVDPAFEMYDACAEAAGLVARHIAPELDFRFPLEQILAALTGETRLIYLTDPNNPTGLPIPPGAIEDIAAAAPHVLVALDEAYSEFSGRTTIGPALDRDRNIVVGRTFAKAHGLAALRVGALVGHPETLAPLRRLLPPYSLNICAVRALEAALDDPAYLDWYVGQSVESRQLIYRFCEREGFHAWPSEANFVLIRVGGDTAALVEALADRGIFIRDRSSAPGCAGCVRITAGVVEHTQLCLDAWEDVLASGRD